MKSKNDIKHTLLTRILHLIHLIAMATLILTGFYIYAPLSFNIFPNMDIMYLQDSFILFLCM